MKKVLTIILIATVVFVSCNNVAYKDKDDYHPEHALEDVSVEASGKEHLQTAASNIDLKALNSGDVIAEATTKYSTENKPRANNIEIASQALNGKVIAAGEQFSYNDTIGPTSEARGYQKAKVFVNQDEIYSFGGGVCQVSSTLYNTVLNSKMHVSERHAHTKRVYYVAKGKDAATSHGVIDFKFINNSDSDIMIESGAGNGLMTVKLIKK